MNKEFRIETNWIKKNGIWETSYSVYEINYKNGRFLNLSKLGECAEFENAYILKRKFETIKRKEEKEEKEKEEKNKKIKKIK
jgi:hypothetical protein